MAWFFVRSARLLVLILLVTLAGTSEAAPFTFAFVLPPWTFSNDAAWFGTQASLAITVDNGGGSALSQAWAFGDVTQLSYATNGTSASTWLSPVSWIYPTTPTSPADTFFTTDGAGVATIDFDLNATHYRLASAPHEILEIDFGADLVELCYNAPPASKCATVEMVASLTSRGPGVPEPTLPALLASIVTAGLAARRRDRARRLAGS